jgi:hypothetical protein
MKLKEQYLDTKICCPLTHQHIFCRFIDKNIYSYYYDKGYSFLFEDEIKENQVQSPSLILTEIEWKTPINNKK